MVIEILELFISKPQAQKIKKYVKQFSSGDFTGLIRTIIEELCK